MPTLPWKEDERLWSNPVVSTLSDSCGLYEEVNHTAVCFLVCVPTFPPNLNLSLIAVVHSVVVVVEFFLSFFFFVCLINHEDPQKHSYASVHWGSQNCRFFSTTFYYKDLI